MSVEASGGGPSVGTSDRSGGNNAGGEHRIDLYQNEGSSDKKFSKEEMEQFDPFEKEASPEESHKEGPPTKTKPKIRTVQHKFLDDDKLKRYFGPKMFSFGPYSNNPDDLTLKVAKHGSYSNNPDDLTLNKVAKHIKVKLAADFLKQNGVDKKVLYEDIKNKINDLKDYYDDVLTNKYKDGELAWMFLVDGCAILQFMYIFVSPDAEKKFRDLGIKTDYAEFLTQDLFLMENQLPYQLIRLIIQRAKLTKKDASNADMLLESIYKFIYSLFRTSFEWKLNKKEILEDVKQQEDHKKDFVHLLDLLRKRLIQPLHQKEHKKLDCWTVVRLLPKSLVIFSFIIFAIIYIWTALLFDTLKFNRNEFDLDGLPIPFHNIGKLRDVGIKLKCSKTICVEYISFSGGTLKLPRIILVESTARIFLNILRYESCPSFQNESEVTTYMYILSKLIVQPRDVEELREKNILLNELGNDEEVVKLFNGISTHLIPNPNLKIYSEMKENIDKYFENKGMIWLRQVSHDTHQYFKRRWSVLAFIGALLAVASSII